MFVHTFDPVLFSVGPLEVRYYGLVYVVGFLLAYYVLERARKSGVLTLTSDEVSDFLFYIMVGVIVGARFVHVVFWDLSYYFSHPLKILYLWEGGMAFHGGLIGAVLAGYYFCKKKSLNLLVVTDLLSFPALVALVLGRLANFMNGELVGTITSVSWCVVFPGESLCRHPVVLYGAIKRLCVLGVLGLLYYCYPKRKPGLLFFVMVLLLGVGRFFIDFMRIDARLFGLSAGQYLSLVMVVVAGYVLWKKYRQ